MERPKYIGMDVHQATIVAVVLSEQGKLLMETVIETKAESLVDWIRGIRGTLHVALEESTQAAWLHELLRPHVTEVVVCDPRKNQQYGNKDDKIDARRLAELLRTGSLTPVYHGKHGTGRLRELVRSYDGLVEDPTRVMNRLKAVFRSRAIACRGKAV